MESNMSRRLVLTRAFLNFAASLFMICEIYVIMEAGDDVPMGSLVATAGRLIFALAVVLAFDVLVKERTVK